MSYHNNPYRVDYLKIYPCLKERPDVLEVLKKSDRKMKYMEVDLKSEQRRKNAENTGKQNRKVLAAPVMGAFASAAGATTLLRQKHGNCPPLQYFYIRFPLPNGPSILSCLFLLRTVPMLVPQR